MKKIALGASLVALAAAGYVLAAGGGAGSGGAARLITLASGGSAAKPGAPAVAATPAPSGRLIAAAAGKGIPDSYICVFKKGEVSPSGARGAAAEAARRGGGSLGHVYTTALQGFSISIPAQAAQVLMDKNPNIAWCEQDQEIVLIDGVSATAGNTGGTTTQPVESTPPGITAVNGGAYIGTNRAFVIDTGIDLTHPDLNVEPVNCNGGSCNFVTRETSPQDLNGHGTHVSGTIAAKAGNGIGVVGVAAGARVIAVRVLNKRGSGSNSDVIAGVDYVSRVGRAGDVANMSLGGSLSTALDTAVLNASAVVKFALAAGNETDDANNHSPGRVNGPNIYTIAAMSWNATSRTGTWASFSNYNTSIVDYIEPGVSILSTWLNGGYNTISGTSMATPHMAGILLTGAPKAGGTVTRTGTSEVYTIGTR
ncbi:S8 family serine peptidase [Novosphingobium cyanobacteriorum]|uniref:S8 family serine peptidase n=1 Tax=Novosphingobium cyanobacteriorum TaxID=3024215 RepID=A0ABT6CEH9_9SPHN|nr:S8 family serine peptidase [Novosphingobium cyanobacteriorum]MDF8332321.1 S8 family serine peptidase [Novosphingobium cyanobacteriorum]